jgi:hypothetical protein
VVRLTQMPFIRVVAQAALEQNKLTPVSYDGVIQWINQIEQQSPAQANDQAIRQASAVLIRRLKRSVPLI